VRRDHNQFFEKRKATKKYPFWNQIVRSIQSTIFSLSIYTSTGFKMKIILPTLILLSCAQNLLVTAFSVVQPKSSSMVSIRQTTIQKLAPVDIVDTAISAATSISIATIDSDIANIPENEFRSVFMGGIVVMFGGLMSALIVGFIVDSRNLYANLVADSYAQGSDDEEFWKGLSEGEKEKAQELLRKVRESREGGSGKKSSSDNVVSTPAVLATRTLDTTPTKITAINQKSTTANTEPKVIGMFNDYGED
jgi:hypothetical protein